MVQNIKKHSILIWFVLVASLLCACSQEQISEAEIENTTEVTEEADFIQIYHTTMASISEQNEAVLMQDACEGGFLALINRKVKEDIPEEEKNNPEFINDGRYDVYESALFYVSKSGKRNKVRRYRALQPPENISGMERFFSETRPRAFRMMEDGGIIALESTYESWLENNVFRSRNRYYIRVLKENGVELSTAEISLSGEGVLDCERAAYLGKGLMAAPHENEILFFNTEGQKVFSVTTPFLVQELCVTADHNLAVVLKNGKDLWLSVVQIENRTTTVPLAVPESSHSFTSGGSANHVIYLRHSEVFSYAVESGESERLSSLLSLGVAPDAIGGFFAGDDDSFHFLIHNWLDKEKNVEEQYVTATRSEENAEKLRLTLGFENISTDLAKLIIDFNSECKDFHIDTLDFQNQPMFSGNNEFPDLIVMDDALYQQVLSEGKLAALDELLAGDAHYDKGTLIPSVLDALISEDGSLKRLAANFRIETMACDWDTVEGKTELSLDELRSFYAMMPAGGMLYEPYYTSDRLLGDLNLVNRHALRDEENSDGELELKLQAFSKLQPPSYNYNNYTASSESMEKLIYDGRLLMYQAHIASLNDLKWYDAFFQSSACFVGWPTEDGSKSRLVFDECVGISAACSDEEVAAAWSFVRNLLNEDFERQCTGFPVGTDALEQLLEEDSLAVTYRLDEKGKFELDKKGRKIEVARSTWYSPEWRKHEVLALTEQQRIKLLKLIHDSV